MNYKSFYRAILLFSLIASVVGGVFMALSIIQSSDVSGVNMFSSSNIRFFDLVFWIFLCCAVACTVASLMLRGKVAKRLGADEGINRIVYNVMGVVLAITAVFGVLREFTAESNGYDHGNMYVMFEKEIDGSISFSLLYFLFTIFLFATSFFCFYAGSAKCKREGGVFAGLSLIPVFAIIFKLIYDFLLQSGNSYGSLYNYHLIGLSFALLFFINEARFAMKISIPNIYVLFGLICASSTLIFSIPALLLFLVGKAGANWHPVFCVVDIVMVAYIYYRLFTLGVTSYVEQEEVAPKGVSLCEDADTPE
ncbi:MAG: hypothetical protein IKK83_02035 [Clostridia bacterium]|nr:hypothetical protein [Clostridia bacterium]